MLTLCAVQVAAIIDLSLAHGYRDLPHHWVLSKAPTNIIGNMFLLQGAGMERNPVGSDMLTRMSSSTRPLEIPAASPDQSYK
jgi:hypothetical protein